MSKGFTTFVLSYILKGKRKPAKPAGIFYALAILLAIAAVTPVWSVNAPTTAFEVCKTTGKDSRFSCPIMPKIVLKMAELILSKESSASEIKRYFNAVLELSKSDNEFPINLDEVWMLVYGRKSDAVEALKRDFIENDDFVTVRQNPQGGKFASVDYSLTLSCLEYFIVKKVRPVFEVYRQVFHKIAVPTLSPIQMQLEMMKSMQIQLQEIIDTKEEVKQLKSELAEVKQRTTTNLDQSTIVAYVSRNNIKLDVTRYGAMGKKASSLCKKRGIEVTKINDVRWGLVSVYPDKILDEVFSN